MCNAFSCIVTRRKKAVWKFGTDSHDELLKIGQINDDTKDPKLIKFCRVEISPKNKNYLNPDKWVFKVDMDFTPAWWTEDHEKAAWVAFQNWSQQLDAVLVRKPIVHPFKIPPPREITDEHIALLREWDSVWDSFRDSDWDSVWDSVGDSVWASVGASVRASVWTSVRASVGDSVWASVWDSVRASVGASVRASIRASFRDSVGDSVGDSVWASVWDSVWAYTGSFFSMPRNDWIYTEKIKTDEYPFLPLVKLWEMGLVPSFDGKTWRLHGGPNATVLWKGVL
jgi:hypothetical protein